MSFVADIGPTTENARYLTIIFIGIEGTGSIDTKQR